MFQLNDRVKSLKTGREGVIQATYNDDLFLMFHGKSYEHLSSSEMELISSSAYKELQPNKSMHETGQAREVS